MNHEGNEHINASGELIGVYQLSLVPERGKKRKLIEFRV